MILLLLLFPFLTAGTPQVIVLNVLMSAIFFFGIKAVSDSRAHLLIALSIGVPWFVLTWREMIVPQPSLALSAAVSVLSLAFFAFTAAVLLVYILNSERVTEDVLYGAVASYLLLGGLWFSAYVLIETLQPGSFFDSSLGAGQTADWTELLYFSFVTLTTLGYGDIVPATLVARHFAVAEAIIGVMYLAIVISRLVGLYIAQSRSTDPTLPGGSAKRPG
jgi:hypothetical protein